MSNLPPKPTPPGEYECCESGCSTCVWDSYYDDMREWNEVQQKAKEAAELTAPNEIPEPTE